MATHNLFVRFLRELEVPHTNRYAIQIYEKHPYKYTLYGLAHLLASYQIENHSFRLTNKSELDTLSVPFLAQVSNDFVIVHKITGNEVVYDWYGEELRTNRSQFNKLWSGVVLLAYPNNQSVEPDLAAHRQADLLRLGKKAIVGGCAFLFLIVAFYKQALYNNILAISLLVVNGLGFYASYLLLLKQMHIQSHVADKFCNLLKEHSCNNLLETRSAQFFNLVSWSEVGFAFFTSNLLLQLFFMPSAPFILAVTGACALPYTIWSVWYQKFRARTWCALCLSVQAILWLHFMVCLVGGTFKMWTQVSIFQVISALCLYCGLPMALNLLLPLITRSRQTTYWQQAHSALRMKDEVFYSLLRAEPHYNVDSQHASSILFGRPDAPVRITIYSNPYCNPCAQMHKRLHHLDHTNCCIQYIFTAFSEAYEPINKYLIAAYQTYGPDKAMLLF